MGLFPWRRIFLAEPGPSMLRQEPSRNPSRRFLIAQVEGGRACDAKGIVPVHKVKNNDVINIV